MTVDPLSLLLQASNWRAEFDQRTLERGAAYAREGRVGKVECEADDVAYSLTAMVRGTEDYQCTIEVSRDEYGTVVDCFCDCPVGRDCKHAAAVLWVIDKSAGLIRAPLPDLAPADPTGPGRSAWENWLESADRTRPAIQCAAAERQFGILLRGQTRRAVARLEVLPVWMRPGKAKGRALVDPQPLALTSRGWEPAPAEGWPEGVELWLAGLQPPHFYGDWLPVDSTVQERALCALLERYPAFHERGSAPLVPGPVLPLQWHWQELADGSQKLVSGLEGDATIRLLRGHRLWYVQSKLRRYGLVEGDAELVAAMDSLPPLQPEHVDAVAKRLQATIVTRALPAPVRRETPQSIAPTPVPVLYLRCVPVNRSSGPLLLGVARLRFDYGPARLDVDPMGRPVRQLIDGRLYSIQRDVAGENAALARLKTAGLVAAGWQAADWGIRDKDVEPLDMLLRRKPRKPPLEATEWHGVLKQLADAGFRLDYEAGFPRDELVEIEGWDAAITPAGNAWFDVSLGVDVAGQRIDLQPVLRRLLADPRFPLRPAPREHKDASWRVPLDETRSAQVPLARLRALIEPLLEWLEADHGDGLRVHRSQAPTLLALDEHLHWRGGERLREQAAQLAGRPRHAETPSGFKATLRPYQAEGLAWLDFLGDAGLGGILADDMGLGKTVQVLAHLLGEKRRGRLDAPALVVAPTSLVGNWRDEAERFAPGLKVLVVHGAERADRYDDIAGHDLVITTYPLLPRDRERLLEQRFALLVLDEAQAIKNARSQAARVVREIPARRRLAMTGTPLENHLGELWAQFDAVEPGLLGSERQFQRLYRTPIEKHGDHERQQRLNRRIGPLLLRRRKDEVLTDLPAKTEIVHTLELDGDQRALYETLRLAQHERVQQAVRERGLAQSGIIVLDALLKLRQACCDPRLVKLPSAKKVKASAKLDALLDLLGGLLSEGRRVLLFSQFTEMLELIEAALHKHSIAHQTLTGQTPARERGARVQRFQQGDVPLFLISLKAGGVGLNLTAADTVIHYDPWWNPAVEAQATDRAHRIGQDKPVFVYRLICKGTVEEKIQTLQARKAELARAVLEGGGATRQLRFDEKDLEALFGTL